ncbi:hypothetical protein [Mucilaginibacter myungsuensis]|uniref:Uncharacterized protein n=1 Tax=Mucilaginibacter myungsuensis TaxID=649104 RepID=A0A929PY28_9SPHI|nr:hypothetical protein [Mucilaginibacter myungsuensis]MBE9663020.1 hypothetical protein [Mucilaginibacter myungsuensis]MDN3598650.1 hypothetical protein [Mucilaginibacter myungsuensis]
MRNIKQFIQEVAHSRKRTGVVWLNRAELLQEIQECGVKVINIADSAVENVIISDDQLIEILTKNEPATSVAFLNLEIFLAPRFKDLKYLSYLLSKVTVQEPYQPVFLLFYSKILFKKFRDHYINQKQTENHFYEET